MRLFKQNNRPLLWLFLLIAVIWIACFPLFAKEFLEKFFYMPFLGTIAATVANTTPAAAGIVYFPILTRLDILPVTAVQFSLIIQAYGMGLGTLKWYAVNKKLFIGNVLPICIGGGIIGVVSSLAFFPIKNPELLTLIFNFIALLLTQFIFFSMLVKKKYPQLTVKLTPRSIAILFFFSLVGGLISGWIGFGIDTMFYFILTVIFHVNPAAAIVTSISIMAAISIVGTGVNLLMHHVPLALWFSAIPGVTVAGLFLASYVAVKLGARNVLLLFTLLLSLDFFITFWTQQTIPMSHMLRQGISYGLIIYLVYIHIRVFKEGYNDMNASLGEFKPDS